MDLLSSSLVGLQSEFHNSQNYLEEHSWIPLPQEIENKSTITNATSVYSGELLARDWQCPRSTERSTGVTCTQLLFGVRSGNWSSEHFSVFCGLWCHYKQQDVSGVYLVKNKEKKPNYIFCKGPWLVWISSLHLISNAHMLTSLHLAIWEPKPRNHQFSRKSQVYLPGPLPNPGVNPTKQE